MTEVTITSFQDHEPWFARDMKEHGVLDIGTRSACASILFPVEDCRKNPTNPGAWH
jgi:hypothetical protein